MDVLKQLIGRLHPLLVHLPIGFIILGLLLQWYDRKTSEYSKIIGLIFLWAGISAIATCITGYLQYLGEGYAFETVKWHLWLGIATAIFSFLMYFKYQDSFDLKGIKKMPRVAIAILLFGLLSFTGHLGGSITHGEDFLVEPLPNSVKSSLGFETFEEKEIALNEENWEEVLIYEDVIKPILNNNCVSCHNSKKMKGELLLYNEEGILKGGETGEVIVSENASSSELFIRMNLPIEDDNHMPPKGKTQPTKEEIKLVGAWIDAGHPFEGSIKDSGLEKGLFLSFFPIKYDKDHPDIEITAANQDSVLSIEKKGVHVDLISKATNFLSVSCINKPDFTDSDFESLQSISLQIAKLDLGGTQVSDAIFAKLTSLSNLTVLKLDKTDVSGNGIDLLSRLKYLKTINLSSSKFNASNLKSFENFESLSKVYLHATSVQAEERFTLKNENIQLDYGSYELPAIASDSIIY